MGSSRNKKQTVGYRYYMAAIFGLCLRATKLLKIVYGERVAWAGVATDGAVIPVRAYDLYGGDETGGSGGLEGNFIFQTGGSSQQPNSVMLKYLGSDCPAHRGLVTLSMDSSYVAAYSPTFRPLYCLVQNLGYDWYPDKGTIAGTQINPAHEIRDALINPDLSGQFSADELDDSSFRAAADTLYSENFGLSPKWNESKKAQEYIQELLDHIDGMLVRDRSTGRIKLKLNRGGYNVASLPVVGESQFTEIRSLGTVTAANMVNKLTIRYARLTDVGEETATLTGENLANIAMQGGVVNASEVEYAHLTDAIADLPGRILARDLRAQSFPLRSFTLVGTSDLASFEEGGLFVFTAPSLGIDRLVCRILEADYGTLDDHQVTLTVTEDIYAVEATAIVTPPVSEWSSPFAKPTIPAVAKLMEMPLYLAERMADYDRSAYPYAGYVMSMAKRNLNIDRGYVHQTYDSGSWSTYGDGNFCDSLLLQEDMGMKDSIIPVPDTTALKLVKNGFGVLGDEIVLISSWSTVSITVVRGVLDTLPAAHSAGSRMWLMDDDHGGVCTRLYSNGSTAQIALVPFNGSGNAVVSTSDRMSCAIRARAFRPYPPAGLSFNGVYLADEITGKLTVSWKHRDRLVDSVVSQTSANIGPEEGTTYTLKVYDENGTLRKNLTGLTGTSWTWDTEESECGDLNDSVRVTLESVRNGYASLQHWDHTVTRPKDWIVTAEGEQVLDSEGNRIYGE